MLQLAVSFSQLVVYVRIERETILNELESAFQFRLELTEERTENVPYIH